MSNPDLIFVGGGLANTLAALYLAERRPDVNFLILEKDPLTGGNHTWSFHGTDVHEDQLVWLAPLIRYSWDSYEVRFPGYTRTLQGSYHSITSEKLATVAAERLGTRIRTNCEVTDIKPDQVTLAGGEVLHCSGVIDGRGPGQVTGLDIRFQKFVGQVVQLEQPHGLSGPIIMDATEEQADGYRFFYTLPFSEDTLLIEDTHYSDAPEVKTDAYGNEIHRYADDRGWKIQAVLREEEGVLPITLGGNLDEFWDRENPGVARSGLRAALFHPATGYSLPDAMRLAEKIAVLADLSAASLYTCTRQHSELTWQTTRFYRVLNRMLFLAAQPPERRRVMERFYKLNENLIARFYAGRNTLADKTRILAGKPPVSLTKAWQAVFGYRAP